MSLPSLAEAVRPDESPLGSDYGAMNAVITLFGTLLLQSLVYEVSIGVSTCCIVCRGQHYFNKTLNVQLLQ